MRSERRPLATLPWATTPHRLYDADLGAPVLQTTVSRIDFHPAQSINMTRSHKFNDKDHAGLADGTAMPQEAIPKYFGKRGFVDADPNKIKKNGGGRTNWGTIGDEVMDEDFNFTNARRRSNSSTLSSNIENFKTKFEINEPEPVFEETMGPEDEERMESSSTGTSSDDKSRKEM